MATNVYSSPLFIGTIAMSTNSADVFTVPAGHTYVVRTLLLQNETASTRAITVRARPAAAGADTVIRRVSLATLAGDRSSDWMAFDAGDRLRLRGDATYNLEVACFGYDLLN